jgi:hypothetical protein
MIKKFILPFALIALLFSLANCKGSGGGSSSAPGGVNTGIPSVVSLDAVQSIVQSNSSAYFKVRVLDGDGLPVKNEPVTFTNLSSPFGTLTAVGTLSAQAVSHTDRQGYATARYWSPTSGFGTVQAEVMSGAGLVRDRRTVFFSAFDLTFPAPPSPSLDLAVDGTDADTTFDESEDFILFENDNDFELTLKATVRDGSGVPVSNSTVTFQTDVTTEVTFPIGSNTATTDGNGVASILMRVDPLILRSVDTLLNVMASAVVSGETALDMATIFLLPVTINSVELSANPLVVPPGGDVNITAFVQTILDTVVPDGTAVMFDTAPLTGSDPDPCGSIDRFDQTTNGSAGPVRFIAPPSDGVCRITGTANGVSGFVDVIVSSDLNVIPSAQTISNPVIGNTATYGIIGGTAPYSAFSNNPGVATVAVVGSTLTATVAGVPLEDTTVQITIHDSSSAGNSVTATLFLDLAPLQDLTVIPSAQTISSPVIGNTADYTILGGTAPYSAFSNNPGVATVAVVGSTLTATVAAVPLDDTVVTITVYDSVGANLPVTLILDIAPLQELIVIPSDQTISAPAIGNTAVYTILGGTAPYTAFSDNPGLATVAVVGPVLTATVAAVPLSDATVTITVYDSVGANVPVTLNLDISPLLGLAVVPASQTIAVPVVGNNAMYAILGGTAPYTAFSDNPALVTAGIVGSTLTATVAAVPSEDVTVTITIFDAAAQSVNATLILDLTPLNNLKVVPGLRTLGGASLFPGATATYTVLGGSGSYLAVSSNPGVATVGTVGPTVTATVGATIPTADTTVIITIYDLADAVAVTAQLFLDIAPLNDLTVIPDAQTLSGAFLFPGATANYTIIGGTGTGTYSAFSDNPGAAAVTSLVGSTLTVTVGAALPTANTTITFSIFDSAAASVDATLTLLVVPLSTMNVFPANQVIQNPTVGLNAAYTIIGGSGSYAAFSDKPLLVSVPAAPAAGSFNATTLAAVASLTADETVTITVVDTVTAQAVSVTLQLDLLPFGTLDVIPAVQTVAGPTGGETATFTIIGGSGVAGNFTVVGDNDTLANVTAGPAGAPIQFTVTVNAVPNADATVTFTVYDQDGTFDTGQLILDVDPLGVLKVAPPSRTLFNPAVADTTTFLVTGGSGNYAADSLDPALATVVGFAGNILTVQVAAVPSENAEVDFIIGDTVTLETIPAKLFINVGSASPLLVQPEAITVTAWDNPEFINIPFDDVTFYITGGTGPFQMFSSDDALIFSQTTPFAGPSFSIDPSGVDAASSGETVTLTVVDSLGEAVEVKVTLLPPTASLGLNPSAISVARGDTVPIFIYGGFGPYLLFQSSGTPFFCYPVPAFLPPTAVIFTVAIPNNVACVGAHTITVEDFLGFTATTVITVN